MNLASYYKKETTWEGYSNSSRQPIPNTDPPHWYIWSNKGYMSLGYLISRPLALHLIKTSYFIRPLYVTFFLFGD